MVQPPASWSLANRIHANIANVFLDYHLVPSDSVQKGGIPAESCQQKKHPEFHVPKDGGFRTSFKKLFCGWGNSLMISLYKAYLVRIPPFQVPEMFGDFMKYTDLFKFHDERNTGI